jgi:hypothetical protein
LSTVDEGLVALVVICWAAEIGQTALSGISRWEQVFFEAAHPSPCIMRGRSTGHNFRLAWLTADSPSARTFAKRKSGRSGPAPTVTHRAQGLPRTARWAFVRRFGHVSRSLVDHYRRAVNVYTVFNKSTIL